MDGMDSRRRLQVDLSPEVLDGLEDLAHDRKKTAADRRLGAGTIAAELLAMLIEHPEVLKELLEKSGVAKAKAVDHQKKVSSIR